MLYIQRLTFYAIECCCFCKSLTFQKKKEGYRRNWKKFVLYPYNNTSACKNKSLLHYPIILWRKSSYIKWINSDSQMNEIESFPPPYLSNCLNIGSGGFFGQDTQARKGVHMEKIFSWGRFYNRIPMMYCNYLHTL